MLYPAFRAPPGPPPDSSPCANANVLAGATAVANPIVVNVIVDFL